MKCSKLADLPFPDHFARFHQSARGLELASTGDARLGVARRSVSRRPGARSLQDRSWLGVGRWLSGRFARGAPGVGLARFPSSCPAGQRRCSRDWRAGSLRAGSGRGCSCRRAPWRRTPLPPASSPQTRSRGSRPRTRSDSHRLVGMLALWERGASRLRSARPPGKPVELPVAARRSSCRDPRRSLSSSSNRGRLGWLGHRLGRRRS